MPINHSNLFRVVLAVFLLLNFYGNCHADNLDQQIDRAKKLLKAGQAKQSAEILNRLLTSEKAAIKKHERHAETWYYFGIALNRLGRKQLAEKALSRARQLKQRQESPAKQQPASTEDTQMNSETKPVTEETANEEPEIQPGKSDAYQLASIKNSTAQNFYRKGAVYLEQGQTQSAADQFIKACEMEKGNKELLIKTCEVLDQIGGSYYKKAQRLYIELEKVAGEKMTAGQRAAQARANIFSGKPDFGKAQKILTDLLAADEKNVEAIVLSAQLDTEKHQYKTAIEKFNKAIKLDKNNLPAYLGLGECYVKMQDFDKAIKILNRARDIWPESFKPLVALGNAYLKNENYGSALQMFKHAFAIDNNNFTVNLGLLEIFVRYNDTRYIKHLEICENIYKGDPRVEYWKAVALELGGKLLEAQNIYGLLALYDDKTGLKAKIRLGQLYSGKGYESFPGSYVVKNRPLRIQDYQKLENTRYAYSYYVDALEKKPGKTQEQAIKVWLNENEDRVREAIRFETLIQSHFKQ
jgi:tetratricopeptide (TPR) repeat protein